MTLRERLPPGKYRLTVDDFLCLDGAGVFAASRTELLDGDIIIMNPEYRPHGWVRDELCYRLRQALEEIDDGLTAMGASVRASDHDLPLPDIVLTGEPRGEGPVPVASVALVVEVSSASLHRDTTDKVAIYARAGIPEYWIADVSGRTICQLWMPSDQAYTKRREVAFGDRIIANTVPDLSIDTGSL